VIKVSPTSILHPPPRPRRPLYENLGRGLYVTLYVGTESEDRIGALFVVTGFGAGVAFVAGEPI